MPFFTILLLFLKVTLLVVNKLCAVCIFELCYTCIKLGIIANPLIGTTLVGLVNVIATYVALLLMDTTGNVPS